jgi:hypothetical protein
MTERAPYIAPLSTLSSGVDKRKPFNPHPAKPQLVDPVEASFRAKTPEESHAAYLRALKRYQQEKAADRALLQ